MGCHKYVEEHSNIKCTQTTVHGEYGGLMSPDLLVQV